MGLTSTSPYREEFVCWSTDPAYEDYPYDNEHPSGICCTCGHGRVPTAQTAKIADRRDRRGRRQRIVDFSLDTVHGHDGRGGERWKRLVEITGEACACPESTAPTSPAVVLDPFGGTGTTALVAHAYGRTGISVDRSADYCRIAEWRTSDPGELAKALAVEKPPPQLDGQPTLFEVSART